MRISLLITAAALAGAVVAEAASVFATQSIYIRNDGGANPTTNQNGDTDVEDLIGWNASQELRALYQFDVSQITNDVNTLGGGNFANLTITSVTLTLYERRAQAQSFQIDVYAYGSNFNETISTWVDPDGDGNIATGDLTAGGTLGALLTSGTVSFATAGNDNDSFTFVDSAAFRNALLAAAQGDGSLELILNRAGTPSGAGFLSFSSDEQGGERRPTLTFNYTVVPEPSVALLGGLGLLGLLRRRRA